MGERQNRINGLDCQRSWMGRKDEKKMGKEEGERNKGKEDVRGGGRD